jgi:autotransporter-associated beta strand protein
MLNPSAQAQTYLWTGNAGGGDFQYSTGANWVGGVAPAFDWAPIPTFDSNVVNGTVNMPVGYIAGSVVVASGATTDITFTGAKLILGKLGGANDATVHLAADGSNLTFNSPIGNAGWDGLLGFDVGAGRTLAINGGIIGNDWGGGPATVVKTGTGEAVITSGTTNIGAMIINAGSVTYANTTAVGGAGSITVNNTGSVNFSSGTAGATITNAISLTGDGGGNAALNVTTPGSSVSFSAITLTGGTLIRALGDGSTINITSGITGTGELVFAGFSGGGTFKNTMVLSGASTFAGDLVIVPWYAATQVTLGGGDNRLPTTALVRVSGSTGQVGALDLNGSNQTIAGLTDAIGWGGADAGTRSVVNTSGTAVTLTLNTITNQSSGVSIGGTDINGTTGNNLALVKSGSATQTLSGANTYTGDTIVTGGILSLGQVNSNNEASTVSITASAGAILDLAFAGTDTVDSLFINGIQQPAGNYTSAHASGAFTGVGTLQVVSGPAGYASWKAINAPGVGPGTTPGADYDGDGVSNGVEFVLGGSKDTNDLSLLPTISQSGANMVFSFQRSQTSIDGTTTVAIEVSPDLISWPDSYNVPGPAQVNNPGITVSKDTSAGFDTITLTVPRAPDITKFARLVVTPAP